MKDRWRCDVNGTHNKKIHNNHSSNNKSKKSGYEIDLHRGEGQIRTDGVS